MICLENSEVDIMRRDLNNPEIKSNDFVLKTCDGAEETLMDVRPLEKEAPHQFYQYKEDSAYKYVKRYHCTRRVVEEAAEAAGITKDPEEYGCYIVARFEMDLELQSNQAYPESYYLIKEKNLTELS